MKWKKTVKYFLILLASATVLLIILANRDLTRMYGGLTERVDTAQFELQSGPISIENVNILSPDGNSFIARQTVIIDDGLIVSVDSATAQPESTRTVDGTGKYLIPGLTDAHVHLLKSPNDLLLYLANGVTQVRELIGEPDHLAWRQQIRNGGLGPELFIASPRIGSFESLEGFFMSWSQGFLNLTNALEAEQEVRKLHAAGYDAIKIYSQINKETYRAVTQTAKSLGMKVVGHIPWSVEVSDLYANQHGIAHLEELMNAMNREFAGFRPEPGKRWDFGGFSSETAEEFLAYVTTRSDKIAIELRENDIAVTTTLWLVESFVRQKTELAKVLKEVELEYENPGISEWSNTAPRGIGWLPDVNRYRWPDDMSEDKKVASRKYWQTYAEACRVILRSLVKGDVKVMAGTDANLPPTVPEFSLHDELISLNNAGMTPAQALRSATAQPAEWLDNNAGMILPGRTANLLLLDKNPLSDISNSKAINSVIKNGQLMNRALLDRILATVRQANNLSRKKDINAYLN